MEEKESKLKRTVNVISWILRGRDGSHPNPYTMVSRRDLARLGSLEEFFQLCKRAKIHVAPWGGGGFEDCLDFILTRED